MLTSLVYGKLEETTYLCDTAFWVLAYIVCMLLDIFLFPIELIISIIIKIVDKIKGV